MLVMETADGCVRDVRWFDLQTLLETGRTEPRERGERLMRLVNMRKVSTCVIAQT